MSLTICINHPRNKKHITILKKIREHYNPKDLLDKCRMFQFSYIVESRRVLIAHTLLIRLYQLKKRICSLPESAIIATFSLNSVDAVTKLR